MKTYPWTGRDGRVNRLKLIVFVLLFVPGLVIAYRLGAGLYMGQPLKLATRDLGHWAFHILVVSLAITPLRHGLNRPPLALLRRMIGVGACIYALLHFILYIASQGFDLVLVANEIVARIYLTIGFVALLGLVALGVTSTDGMIRRMGGKRWQMLHRLTYGIGLLAIVHYFLQAKQDLTQPMVMAGVLFILLASRVVIRLRWMIDWRAMSLLGLAAALGTALGEAGYFKVKFGAPLQTLLATNFATDMGWRPAVVVALIATIAASLMAYRARVTART